ncbi:equilibrative nucleotide transporter 3-like isoform X2 [Apium graveolens]|uniref:equilibrative nucleotide transporter 3-like isoform X2 n=1 Tax=Apium graveolens TaxID=4045 RepID=UPI003D7AAE4C
MGGQVTNGAAIQIKGKYAAMVVCWLLGVGCLLPWNSMLTVEDYYMTLFPRYHPARILSLAYQPFNVGTVAVLTYNEARINTRRRNLCGFSIHFTSTLLVLVVDLASSGKGGIGPFIALCAISGAFGFADAHVQGGIVGDLSFMLPDLMQSFLAGNAASGAFTSGLRLVTKAAFEKSKSGLRKGSADLAAAGIQTQIDEQDEEDSKKMERLSHAELLTQNIDYAIGLFLIYVLTLSVFPGFLSEDIGKHSLGEWYALVLIATYNVWDLIGRYVPLLKFVRLKSRKGLMIVILSRFLLIPAFYFTAKYGGQAWMILLTSFLGLTNGYLTVCVFTSAPNGYKGPEQNALGNILSAFLMSGLFAGVVLDWLWLIGKGW